jgi:hypothetical protein
MCSSLPTCWGNLRSTVKDKQIGGQYFLQEYRLTGGQAAGPVCQRPHRRSRAHVWQRQDSAGRDFPGRQLLPDAHGGDA